MRQRSASSRLREEPARPPPALELEPLLPELEPFSLSFFFFALLGLGLGSLAGPPLLVLGLLSGALGGGSIAPPMPRP